MPSAPEALLARLLVPDLKGLTVRDLLELSDAALELAERRANADRPRPEGAEERLLALYARIGRLAAGLEAGSIRALEAKRLLFDSMEEDVKHAKRLLYWGEPR